eukprot:TRINITY_DN4912_c1_g1_i1.p1 TRINITY_DN4912_c1_g1~~TRINITY_DN4912_c1_g1_i1.p1  ORF type:complete len:336 (+),score=50.11 TRINITY_DN4912_c1_g1_i1:262-1269(+)
MDTTLAIDAGLMKGVIPAPPPPPPPMSAAPATEPTPPRSWLSDVRRGSDGGVASSLWTDDALANGLDGGARIRGPSGLATAQVASSTDRVDASAARLWPPTVEGHTTASWSSGVPYDGRVTASVAAPAAPSFFAPAPARPDSLAGGTHQATAATDTAAMATLEAAAAIEAAAAADVTAQNRRHGQCAGAGGGRRPTRLAQSPLVWRWPVAVGRRYCRRQPPAAARATGGGEVARPFGRRGCPSGQGVRERQAHPRVGGGRREQRRQRVARRAAAAGACRVCGGGRGGGRGAHRRGRAAGGGKGDGHVGADAAAAGATADAATDHHWLATLVGGPR